MVKGGGGQSPGCSAGPRASPLLPTDGASPRSVPTKDPSGESLIMSPEEFARIKWASHVLTREEHEAREQALRKEKEAIVVAARRPWFRRGRGALGGGVCV